MLRNVQPGSSTCFSQPCIQGTALVVALIGTACIVMGAVCISRQVLLSSQVSYSFIGGGSFVLILSSVIAMTQCYRKLEPVIEVETKVVTKVVLEPVIEVVTHPLQPCPFEKTSTHVPVDEQPHSYLVSTNIASPSTFLQDPSRAAMQTSLLLFLEENCEEALVQQLEISLKMLEELKSAITTIKPNPMHLFANTDLLTIEGDRVKIRADLLALYCLLSVGSSEEVNTVFGVVTTCREAFPTWQENIKNNLSKSLLINKDAKLISLLTCRVYSAFNYIHELNPAQAKAYRMRSYAHSWAYHYPEAGDYDPMIGEVVWTYRMNGICTYISIKKEENAHSTVHWFFAGTHNIEGLIRDLDTRSPATSLNKQKDVEFMVDAVCCLTAALQTNPFLIQFHGHSLGGHDAQIMCAEFISSNLIKYLNVTEVLVNTQNGLKVDESTQKQFQEAAQNKKFKMSCYHGFVEGDIVHTAGHCALNLPNGDTTVIVFKPLTNRTLGRVEAHTLPAHHSTPTFPENSQKFLVGSQTTKAVWTLASLAVFPIVAAHNVFVLFDQKNQTPQTSDSPPSSSTEEPLEEHFSQVSFCGFLSQPNSNPNTSKNSTTSQEASPLTLSKENETERSFF